MTHISIASTPPPKFLFIELNKRCNLRCGHCHFWKLDDKDMPNYLRLQRLRSLVAEFAALPLLPDAHS